MKVREARVGDAAGIAHVHVLTWQGAYRGLIPDEILDALSVERRTEDWRRALASPAADKPTWVAELDGAVIGFAGAGPCRDPDGESLGELYAIYVLPEHQGVGAGRALMEAATAWLAGRFEEATLWVLEGNDRTRFFYEHLGWRADGGTKSEQRGPFVLDEVRYRTGLIG